MRSEVAATIVKSVAGSLLQSEAPDVLPPAPSKKNKSTRPCTKRLQLLKVSVPCGGATKCKSSGGRVSRGTVEVPIPATPNSIVIRRYLVAFVYSGERQVSQELRKGTATSFVILYPHTNPPCRLFYIDVALNSLGVISHLEDARTVTSDVEAVPIVTTLFWNTVGVQHGSARTGAPGKHWGHGAECRCSK